MATDRVDCNACKLSLTQTRRGQPRIVWMVGNKRLDETYDSGVFSRNVVPVESPDWHKASQVVTAWLAFSGDPAMTNPLETQEEIVPLLFKRKFLLAYGTHAVSAQRGLVGNGYWHHGTGTWVSTPEEATAFDTRAGSLVYRRGNLQRMQMALQELRAHS